MARKTGRRQFLGLAGTSAAAAALGPGVLPRGQSTGAASTMPASATGPAPVPPPGKSQWSSLSGTIQSWWSAGLHQSDEPAIRSDSSGSLLFLPFGYDTPGGTYASFGNMYDWDTYFINRGLLAQGQLAIAANHIRNYLFMVERYGFMPNGNATFFLTRSQTPVFPDSVWRYYQASGDKDLAYLAYPLLKREYQDYWNAPPHRTTTGLSTNWDSGDKSLSPQMAAEAETGLDWTPIFNAQVTHCTPLITNCALVRYAQVLAALGDVVGQPAEAAQFRREAATRSGLIRNYCWNESQGLFVEYDYVAQQQLPYFSNCAYWPMWAGVATKQQAGRLVAHWNDILQPWGLPFTDKAYPDPYPSSQLSAQDLQWMYPAGWPNMQLIAVEALDAYGYHQQAEDLASRFLSLILTQYSNTGKLWEKYNVVDGSLNLPNARYGIEPLQGWTAATAVLLGQRLFNGQSLTSLH